MNTKDLRKIYRKMASELEDDEIRLRLDRITEAIPEKKYQMAYRFSIVLHPCVVVGVCSLRVGTIDELYYAGHIGYGIHEAYRGHHYASKACVLLFKLARAVGLSEVIITCNPENIASRKTMERVGCVYIEHVLLPEDHEMYRLGERSKLIYKKSLL
ncbi:MAG: GNAT family N-acetyltransferase [Candidatus Izemoplasmatales bacterium]|jgi:predicted acetyltransferase|nr:GNAT family N-acetyltransferase [Candidatus Izemoplasmatales bacterium]